MVALYWKAESHPRIYTPAKWTNVPWKGTFLKGDFIFQPSILRGYVSVQDDFVGISAYQNPPNATVNKALLRDNGG